MLRSWRLSDVQPYHHACNRKSVMRWLGGVQSPSELLGDVAYFMASETNDGVTFWVVERRSDGAFLGFCGLVRIPDADCPFKGKLEIGWRLRESVWRRGYGFETATAVLDHAFSKLGATEVVSRTANGNKASKALMRKLGMRRNPGMDYQPRRARRKLIAFVISAAQWRRCNSGSLA
jgi:RimJ/RimL family protein N-acetyltransferase